MIPEQLTQPPVRLRSPASPKNYFFYIAMKVHAEKEIFLVVFEEEIRRNVWPERVTEVNWFEVIGRANQEP